ncbi:MAG: epimerase [Candidatus Binatia bacterium]|nr:MAG: epimerase [Fimbriimonadales bacterium]GIW44845.1 MAG: epimerase [Candidatus Binatia bacterium]
MRILITGGNGTLGRELTTAAVQAGYLVRIGSRHGPPHATPQGLEWVQIQLANGSGLAAAVERVEAVIHAASNPRRATTVDVEGTRHLIEACRVAGVKHLVYVSIVGIEEIPLPYYRCKLQAERIVAQSGVPFSILRATQFHTFLDGLLSAAARFPLIMPLPTDFQVQSVAPSEVAARLVRALAEGPAGRLPDFGGPEVMTLGQAAEQWGQIRGRAKRRIHLCIPGRVAAGFRAGKNVVLFGEHGTLRWSDWLRLYEVANHTRPA